MHSKAIAVRQRNRRLTTMLAAFLVLAVLAVIWVEVIRVISTAQPVQTSRSNPDSFVWGSRVFANPQQFAAYLGSIGISYRSWVRQHPGAARLLDPLAHPASTPAKAKAGRATTTRVAAASKTTLGSAAGSKSASSSSHDYLVWLLGLVGVLALGAGAVALIPRVAASGRMQTEIRPEAWIYAGAVASAVLLAFAIAYLIR